MRKPLVSQMMHWIATVTIQSLLTAILLGPLFTPISLTTALKLNGTTTTTTAVAVTPGVNYAGASGDNIETTIASFLQPDSTETTLSPPQLSNQVDELTTTQGNHISPSQSVSSSAPLTKRHSSIVVGESSSQDDDGSPRFITKASSSSSSSSTENDEDSSKEKPQRNGTRVSSATNIIASNGEDGEHQQSLSLSSGDATAEEKNENGDNAAGVPSTTRGDAKSEDEEGGSASTNSLGDNDADSSVDKDDSDSYFSAGDDDADEGDSDAARGGEVGGDTIFPPDEDRDLDTNESVGATTFASLLRPAPTTNPQTFSFSSQLANKLNRGGGGGGGGTRLGNSRLGTRGLSAKSELNAITTTTTTTTAQPPPSANNTESDVTSDSDSSGSASETVAVAQNQSNDNNNRNYTDNISDSTSNIDSNSSNSSSFELNGSSFQSRSNANIHTQQQHQSSPHLLRARPTSSVINNYNSNSNHNNNLHNRIIKRKKIPFSRGSNNSASAGSSLSSIYENSIVTSTLPSSSNGENAEATTATTPSSSSVGVDSALLSSTAGVSATTETNSLVNASHDGDDDDDETSSRTAASNKNAADQQQQSSPASISGGAGAVVDDSNSSSNSNVSTPLSSSRAILGFGTSPPSTSNYGKVKRPKPIIIRDRDDSVYINNLPENTATASGGGGAGVDETATVSGAAGEEESNRPVGSNALPTPPYKMRRVKLTSRRISTPTPRPTTEDYFVSPTSPTFVVPSASFTTNFGAETNSSTDNGLMAQAASGATDYRDVQHVIRPSITHEGYNESPQFSSRRVYKEEFGITRNSYGGGDDHRADDEDGDLQATTEYFALENPTPYPIPMGVRSAPQQIESEDNDEEQTGRNPGKNSDSGSSNSSENRYRDYYSEIRSRSVEAGGAGSSASGNLHIKSDSPQDTASVSPVTVTVTHTVVKTTPHITPTSTAEITLSGQSNGSHHNDSGNNEEAETGADNSDDKSIHPNLLPTPALPSSIFVNPTATQQSSFETGQGPAIISHSVDNVQFSTSRFGISQTGIQSSHHDDDADDSHKGNDQNQESHDDDGGKHEEKVENTPVMNEPQQIQPTPTVSSKSIKSVYFTQVEHPNFASSSYEFTSSTMYSYSFPDHDSTHTDYPDMMNHDDHMDHHHRHDDGPHPASQGNIPNASAAEPERGHSPEATSANGTRSSHDEDEDEAHTTVLDGKYFTPSPTPPQFWDDSGNLTKSSSSQVPIITMDQESAIPTPTIDIDIYPPIGTGPNSKPEDGSTTPVAPALPTAATSTGSPRNSTNAPGSLEENEISEEEQRKQQQQNVGSSSTSAAAAGSSTTTTIKPSGADDVTTMGKDKSEDDNATKSPEAGKESKNKDNTSPAPSSSEIKTPFGVGESFGIGSVHVPIMVQMVLDVAQPVFCSHLSNFKRMIVTVYGTQKKIEVAPDQIVLYTDPGCDPVNKSGDSQANASSTSTVTVTPRAATPGKTFTPTPKGTFPLTSPPTTPPSSNTEGGDDTKRSRSGKDAGTVEKNGTQSSSESPSDLNKSSLSGNKSAEEDEESAHQNKSAAAIRSRRSTKMDTAAASSIKNTNISSKDTKESSSNLTSSATENLLSVYFYVNNKNGSYDQELTSSFVRLWNDSSRLTNVSGNNGNNNDGSGEEDAGGNDGSSTNNNSSAEMFIQRVKKVGMISASQLVSSQEPSDENSGIIVAITVASIVAVCLFVLGVGLLIMRHRQSQTKFAKRCTPVTLDDYSLDNISVYNSFRRKQRLRGSKRSYTNAAFDDHNAPSRPVNAQALANIVSDVASLENEFRAIPNITATLDDIPQGAETKNRYANVIPMPDTRVLLTFLDDVPNSDYINANYVRGVTGENKRYIITQGPLEDTVVDFWRMVWEQQIRVIFMMTDFAEGGINKCSEYYPRSETIDCSQLHGDFQITLERRDIADNCITSYLVLKDMERNLRRDVVHFWYHSWPEKGVPASPKMTIDFLNRSKKFTKEPTPILVHCSPGTGRSGTVVACDIAMKEYDAQNKVDIPRTVMKIRQDRAGAVQTKEQYLHIYEVLHCYASRIGGAAHLESI